MKKFLCVAVSLIVILVMAVGCSSSQETVSAGASPTKNTEEFYGTWTKEDWESATPEEKELAVIFLVSEAVASEGADEEVVQSTVDDAEESLTPDQYSEIEDAITAYYDKSDEKANLQDALNDVKSTISKYVPIG